MKFTYDMLDSLSDQYGLDIFEILDLLGEPLTDEEGVDYWMVDDNDGNGVPDILQDLIDDPISTNPSQGGILG